MSEAFAPERLFRFQAAGCRLPASPSPFYAEILDALAVECEAGNTDLLALMARMPATVQAASPLRLMGGAQRCVLDGTAPDLAAAWPGDGRPGDAASAISALLALCAAPPHALLAALESDPQTNEVGRAAALAPGLAEIVRRVSRRSTDQGGRSDPAVAANHETGLPVRLLEIGASAGLLSRLDRYSYTATNASWGGADSGVQFSYEANIPFDAAPEISERRACDLRPIDATTLDGARRLLSYCWPDQHVRLTRLRAALDIAATMPLTIDEASADEWLDEHMHPHDGTTTVVMHSIMWQYLPATVQERIEQLFAERGAAATASAPLARLELEPSPEVVHADVNITVWPGTERTVLANSGYHGPPVTWLGSIS